MEGISVLMLIITLIFGILGLILFFKIWGMTEDVKKLKNHFLNESVRSYVKDNVPGESSSYTTGSIMNGDKEILYTMNNNGIDFSDGLQGKIKIYPGYPQCSVITKNGYELLYNNKDAAIKALYIYLTSGEEMSTELYEKRACNKNLVKEFYPNDSL